MSDMLTLPISLPREFANLLGTDSQANETAKEFIALGLYQEGRISAGKAANLLGMTKHSFIALLARKGIDYFRQTLDEWAEEVATINTEG